MRLEIVGKFFLALASTVLLLIGGAVLPAAGFVLLPFVPQPVLFFGVKYGAALAMGVLCAALLVLSLVSGGVLAAAYSVFAVMVGLLLFLLGRLRSIELLVTGIAVAMLSMGAGLLRSFYGSWGVMIQDFRDNLNENLAAAMRAHEKMGFPQDSLTLLKEKAPEIVEQMLQLLPGLLYVSLCLIVLFNILMLCRRFPDHRSRWLNIETFREWKCPEPLVWGLIGCGFALFVPAGEAVQIVAVNLLLVIGVAYFIQGLAVVAYFFHKNNVPRFLRSATYILIVFQQIFTLLVAALGLFDLWGDFRRLKKKNLNPSQAS
jgi:uncharacterized protein YybS (DUF2232 family)